MIDCEFCGNHLVETRPAQVIGGSLTRAVVPDKRFKWACDYCVENK